MNLDPLNAAALVLNGSMLLCLVIVIALGRRALRRSRARKGAVMLMTDARQCRLGFRRIAWRMHHQFTLPPLGETYREENHNSSPDPL